MKILVLNYEFPPVGGGGGRASADLCRALVGRGHEIRVITSYAPGLPKVEEKQGYIVLRTPSGRKDPSVATFVSMLGYILGGVLPALREIRTWKPAILHVHFAVPTGVLAWVLSTVTGKPYVLTAHLGDVPGGVPEKTDRWFRWIRWVTPPIWKRAAFRVAVSGSTRDLALQHYAPPITVIPNGVFLPGGEDRNAVEVGNPPRIIFAGRFQPQKNLIFLIEALSAVRDVAWECVLLGDGPDRERIEAAISSHALGERITLKGWVSSDEVWDRLGRSDVLAMPSLTEGLPVVGIQALAQGVAIVGTQAGGLMEVIRDRENGRLCPIGDAQCFQKSLRWCLEDRDRLSNLKRSSLDLAQRFDIRAIAAEYESLFEAAVAPVDR